ncbi:hypothetical protein ABPG72_000185 [Tetrahymena utriculariae]
MENQIEYINFFIKVVVDNEENSFQRIYSYLSKSLGEDLNIGERRVYQIAKDVRENNRSSVQRQQVSGQSPTKRIPENIDAVQRFIEEDQNLSIQSISDKLDLSSSTVQRILKDDLNKVNLYARWVPHQLTQQQKKLQE